MDTFTTEQTFTYPFQVLDGRGRPAAIDGAPTTLDSDPSVATSAVTAGTGVGNWNLILTATGTPSLDDGAGNLAVAQTTVKVDANTSAGVDEKVGSVQYSVSLDPRTGAKSLSFGSGVGDDKPI